MKEDEVGESLSLPMNHQDIPEIKAPTPKANKSDLRLNQSFPHT